MKTLNEFKNESLTDLENTVVHTLHKQLVEIWKRIENMSLSEDGYDEMASRLETNLRGRPYNKKVRDLIIDKLLFTDLRKPYTVKDLIRDAQKFSGALLYGFEDAITIFDIEIKNIK